MFKFERSREEEYELDVDVEPLTEGMAEVRLSKETKSRIREPWSKALIVKVFGRIVGFNYLIFKINALWKPYARMDCVNLGKDFFLIRFSNTEDYDKVLRGGPWFVGEHSLAIRPWEPYFKASEAKFSLVAVWVRLPELPIEFYEQEVLREIGEAIGLVLRIDAYAATESRGSYVRLCVQINLEEPLTKWIRVGRIKQQVLYEGISMLCFCCGRLGHKQEQCCYKVKQTTKLGEEGESSHNEERIQEEQTDGNFGPWMLVTRRRSPAKNGRNKTPINSGANQEGPKGFLGNQLPNLSVVEDYLNRKSQGVKLNGPQLVARSFDLTQHMLGEEGFDLGSNKASGKEPLGSELDVIVEGKEVHATYAFKSGATKELGNKRSKGGFG